MRYDLRKINYRFIVIRCIQKKKLKKICTGAYMIYKVCKLESVKVLDNIDCLKFEENKIKPNTC